MKVKIKKINDLAKIPTKVHDQDFCYDVYATSCEEVEPGIWKYGIGLAFEIVRDSIILGKRTEYFGYVIDSANDDGLTAKGHPNSIGNSLMIDSKHYSNVKLSIDFRPRSSIWKTGLILSNCEGTIDELYRGEVLAYFYEVIPGKEKYKVGDRIGQIKLGFTLPIEFEEVDELSETERGENGFGSTGK